MVVVKHRFLVCASSAPYHWFHVALQDMHIAEDVATSYVDVASESSLQLSGVVGCRMNV